MPYLKKINLKKKHVKILTIINACVGMCLYVCVRVVCERVYNIVAYLKMNVCLSVYVSVLYLSVCACLAYKCDCVRLCVWSEFVWNKWGWCKSKCACFFVCVFNCVDINVLYKYFNEQKIQFEFSFLSRWTNYDICYSYN